MGRRLTPSVDRLTVLHVVGVVRLQDDRRIVKTPRLQFRSETEHEHAYNYNFQYDFVNGNGNRTRSNVAIPNMAVEEGSGCTCTTDDVVQLSVFNDPRPGELELPTAGDVEWLLFSYT